MIDASIAVKWLVREAFSDEAAGLLDGGSPLVAPALLFAEAVNALWVMQRRGDMSMDDLSDAVDTLRSAPVSCPTPMPELAAAAAQLATDLDHPAYDCFYLALAIQTQYTMVTADTRFHERVHTHPYLSNHILHVTHVATRRA